MLAFIVVQMFTSIFRTFTTSIYQFSNFLSNIHVSRDRMDADADQDDNFKKCDFLALFFLYIYTYKTSLNDCNAKY